MTVTVLQRKAKLARNKQASYQCQQLKELSTLIYILTSQPELTKLYNENIGGHPYTFTVSLQVQYMHEIVQAIIREYGSTKDHKARGLDRWIDRYLFQMQPRRLN